MEKEFISGREYNQILETTRWIDDNGTTVDKIIETFEYLKNKKTEDNFMGKVAEIKNARLDFLRTALDRMYFFPKVNEATEQFLKSDYLSEELKKEIISVLNGNCSSEVMTLLNSSKHTNEFSKEEIKEIINSINRIYDSSKDEERDEYGDLIDVLNNYFFVIDGDGPIEYIKEKYGQELPIVMLECTGVISQASYYSGIGVNSSHLGEEHLFSLYKKFVKYYPDKAEEFVKMIFVISRLTPTEFINNYHMFIKNGLNSNFRKIKGNISVDDAYGQTRDMIGAISIFSMFKKEESELDRQFQSDMHWSIRNNFLKMVSQYKSLQEGLKTRILRK